MGQMVGSVLDASDLPSALRELIGEKAEGNPFFVEEITKSLIEEGVLRVEGQRVVLARDLADVSVPDSIHDVLMARIDRLPEQPKRAIQVASVIGREFALRLLERISDAGERMGAVVDELRALELIYEKASHPELAFMFKHALTHDVAYASVLVERRKALHLIVGAAIEELYRDRLTEHYEVLASHFSAAEAWPRAFEYRLRAARKAADAFANHAAAEHCREALAIAGRMDPPPQSEELAELEGTLGAARFTTNEFRAAADALVRAAELSADDEGKARNLGRAAYSYTWGHDYVAAGETVRRARDLARAVGADAADAIAMVAEFELAMVTEGVTDKAALASQAVQLAEQTGDDEALAYAHTHEAQRLEWRGDYPAAIAHAERALEAALRVRNPVMAMFARWYMGLSRAALGQYGSAVAVLREALELSRSLGDRALSARFLNTLGWCHAEFGAHRLASEYNRESTVLAGEMVELKLVPSAAELYANGAINLAGNLIALGDPDGAGEALAPIQADLERDGDPWMRWRYSLHVLDANARLALAKGDPERALAFTSEELNGARRHTAHKLEARALELQGRALVAMDQRPEAEMALRQALEVGQRIQYPPVLWRAHSLLGELALRNGDVATAGQLSTSARDLVVELAGGLHEEELRSGLTAIAERIADDPLAAYR
jgi:predicted ATPase